MRIQSRGWTVVAADGTTLGEVKDRLIDPSALKATRGGNLRVLVDAYEADVVERSQKVMVSSDISSLEAAHSTQGCDMAAVDDDRGAGLRSDDREAARLTRPEEERRIGKPEVEAGEVVVNETVETEHVREPVARRVERVRVERRPVHAGSTENVEITADEVRVPNHGEGSRPREAGSREGRDRHHARR